MELKLSRACTVVLRIGLQIVNGARYSWLDLFAVQFGMLTSFLQRFLRGASKKRKLAESLGKDTPGDAKSKRSFKLSKITQPRTQVWCAFNEQNSEMCRNSYRQWGLPLLTDVGLSGKRGFEIPIFQGHLNAWHSIQPWSLRECWKDMERRRRPGRWWRF